MSFLDFIICISKQKGCVCVCVCMCVCVCVCGVCVCVFTEAMYMLSREDSTITTIKYTLKHIIMMVCTSIHQWK